MIGLLKIILSANFIIGAAVGILAVVGYLYYTGSEIIWIKGK